MHIVNVHLFVFFIYSYFIVTMLETRVKKWKKMQVKVIKVIKGLRMGLNPSRTFGIESVLDAGSQIFTDRLRHFPTLSSKEGGRRVSEIIRGFAELNERSGESLITREGKGT